MNIKFFFLFVNCILSTVVCFSQQPEEQPLLQPPVKQFKHSIKAGAGLPVILSNEPFRKAMEGVYSVNASADFTVYKHITGGVYYGYTMFDNAELKNSFNGGRRPDITKCFISTAGASIGYQKFTSENKVFSISANTGYSWLNYQRTVTRTDTLDNLYKSEGLNFGFTTSYSVVIEETGAVGFYISYRYINDVFDAGKIRLIGEANKNKTQFVALGVVFTLGI